MRRSLPEAEWGSLLFEEDLDRGLERCEQVVIDEWHRLHGESEEARTTLFGLSIDEAVRQLERQAQFEELTDRLQPWLVSRTYAADETIVARGERQEGMQLLVRGRATMRGEKDGARMGEFGPGSALAPQAILENHVAVVEMTAEEPCHTVLMSPSSHQSLEREDPELTLALARYPHRGGSRRSDKADQGRRGRWPAAVRSDPAGAGVRWRPASPAPSRCPVPDGCGARPSEAARNRGGAVVTVHSGKLDSRRISCANPGS